MFCFSPSITNMLSEIEFEHWMKRVDCEKEGVAEGDTSKVGELTLLDFHTYYRVQLFIKTVWYW